MATTLVDYERYLSNRRIRLRADAQLLFHLSTGNISQVRELTPGLIRGTLLTAVSLFDREGQQISVLTAVAANEGKSALTPEPPVFLSDAFRNALERQGQVAIADVGVGSSLDLISLTRLETKGNRLAGVIEEIITLGPAFLENLKKRVGLDVIDPCYDLKYLAVVLVVAGQLQSHHEQ